MKRNTVRNREYYVSSMRKGEGTDCERERLLDGEEVTVTITNVLNKVGTSYLLMGK